jgi:hypothetical protein
VNAPCLPTYSCHSTSKGKIKQESGEAAATVFTLMAHDHLVVEPDCTDATAVTEVSPSMLRRLKHVKKSHIDVCHLSFWRRGEKVRQVEAWRHPRGAPGPSAQSQGPPRHQGHHRRCVSASNQTSLEHNPTMPPHGLEKPGHPWRRAHNSPPCSVWGGRHSPPRVLQARKTRRTDASDAVRLDVSEVRSASEPCDAIMRPSVTYVLCPHHAPCNR